VDLLPVIASVLLSFCLTSTFVQAQTAATAIDRIRCVRGDLWPRLTTHGFLRAKYRAARRQPLQCAGSGLYADSFFNGSHNPFHDGGCYSIHAMGAMAVATVIARRHHNHLWVPFVAYGMAGAMCFSRITTSNHFPADVFFGGAMGYVISRYAVLPARF
jgi:membrane-associated phospholipid phosphatase